MSRIPSSAICPTATSVLIHVAATPYPTVRSCAAAAGCAVATAHKHLVRLRRLGLVRWEVGRQGTLRPAVGIVA